MFTLCIYDNVKDPRHWVSPFMCAFVGESKEELLAQEQGILFSFFYFNIFTFIYIGDGAHTSGHCVEVKE